MQCLQAVATTLRTPCTGICQGFAWIFLMHGLLCVNISSVYKSQHTKKKRKKKEKPCSPSFQTPQGIGIVRVQKRKPPTSFRKLRVLNIFCKPLLSIFNVQESQYRLARQKRKQASKTLESIIEKNWGKKNTAWKKTKDVFTKEHCT